jgi:hypothetical protein
MKSPKVAPRRRFLTQALAFATSYLSTVVAWSADEGRCCTHKRLELDSDATGLSVSLHGSDGAHLEAEASVRVVSTSGETVTLHRKGLIYIEPSKPLKPGPHTLLVDAPGYASSSVTVTLEAGTLPVPVYLRERDWPEFSYFNLGPSVVPFEPVYNKIAIVFGRPLFQSGVDSALLLALASMGLVPYTPPGKSYIAAKGEILLFQSKTPLFAEGPSASGLDSTEALFASLRDFFKAKKLGPVRIGIPIVTRSGVKVLDHQFIIEVPAHLNPGDVRSLVHGIGAEEFPVRGFKGFWMLRFKQESNYFKNLGILEQLLEGKIIVSWEPDLVFELILHGCSTPTDPWFDCQEYIARQKVPAAWAKTCGAGVVVTMIDTGIPQLASNHPDYTKGRVFCFDLMHLTAASTVPPDQPPTCEFVVPGMAHGMGIYGIINAEPNSSGIAGIAHQATFVSVRINNAPSSLSYATTLAWAGDLGNGSLKPVNNYGNVINSAPRLEGAHVLNCSHTIIPDRTALPCLIAKAFDMLTTGGRGGKGTVIVYSAGQADGSNGMGTDMHGIIGASMSPCTLMVGNTADDATDKKEKHDLSSNYGARLDICAFAGLDPGQNTVGGVTYEKAGPTLKEQKGVLPGAPQCNGNDADGIQFMGRTSSAAAMVSGAAALVLAMNPSLKWYQVRAILQSTAEKIDSTNCGTALGQWVNLDGSACPPVAPGLKSRNAWYGYGRLDVLAAVDQASTPPTVEAPTCCR